MRSLLRAALTVRAIERCSVIRSASYQIRIGDPWFVIRIDQKPIVDIVTCRHDINADFEKLSRDGRPAPGGVPECKAITPDFRRAQSDDSENNRHEKCKEGCG